MYDRAPRKLVSTFGSTGPLVGPGAYNVESISKAKLKFDGYAPFMSLTTRDAYSTGSALESEGIPVPGPGYYDLQNAKAALNPAKGTSVLNSRVRRFGDKKDNLPGPGAYNVQQLSAIQEKRPVQTDAQGSPSRIKYVRNPEAPSIPIPQQAYGFEESDDGRLVRQLPPARDISIGPAFYSPHAYNTTLATRKYNGVHFGNRTSKRDLSLGQVGVENPGPGAYNVQEGRAGDSVNLNSVTAAKNSTSIEALSLELPVPRRHTSPAKRFTEEVQLKAEREKIPGPGFYPLPREFDSRSKKAADVLGADIPPFGTQTKRFPDHRRVGPGPGEYNDPRNAFESLRRVTGLKRSPFGVTDSRFKTDERVASAPGPGDYSPNVGLGAVTMRKLIMESARKGAFGTSAARVLQMDQRSARDVSEQPGPANYAPKSRPFKPKYDAMSAAFSSMSMRFNEPPDTDETALGPGAYNVAHSYEASQGRVTPGPPRTEMGRKRRRAFLVSSERFRAGTIPTGGRVDTDVPGPAMYDVWIADTILNRKGGVTIGNSTRFAEKDEAIPGPGTYKLSAPVRDATFRGTFNVTLGGYGSKRGISLDMPVPSTSLKPGDLTQISAEQPASAALAVGKTLAALTPAAPAASTEPV